MLISQIMKSLEVQKPSYCAVTTEPMTNSLVMCITRAVSYIKSFLCRGHSVQDQLLSPESHLQRLPVQFEQVKHHLTIFQVKHIFAYIQLSLQIIKPPILRLWHYNLEPIFFFDLWKELGWKGCHLPLILVLRHTLGVQSEQLVLPSK